MTIRSAAGKRPDNLPLFIEERTSGGAFFSYAKTIYRTCPVDGPMGMRNTSAPGAVGQTGCICRYFFNIRFGMMNTHPGIGRVINPVPSAIKNIKTVGRDIVQLKQQKIGTRVSTEVVAVSFFYTSGDKIIIQRSHYGRISAPW